jgi:hypothetical protein
MAEQLDRLDAVRETLASKEAEADPRRPRDTAKSNRAEVLEKKGNGGTADFVPSIISET